MISMKMLQNSSPFPPFNLSNCCSCWLIWLQLKLFIFIWWTLYGINQPSTPENKFIVPLDILMEKWQIMSSVIYDLFRATAVTKKIYRNVEILIEFWLKKRKALCSVVLYVRIWIQAIRFNFWKNEDLLFQTYRIY